MRFLVGLFLLFFCFQIKAQQLTGYVVDKDSVGILGAHVFYPEIIKGTSTDSNGYFAMEKIPQFKNVLISCIGYCDTVVPIEKISNSNILLKENDYVLEEVSVTASIREELEIGSKKKKPNGANFITKGNNKNGSWHGWEGWLFYFPRNSNAKVESIGVHVKDFDNPNLKICCRVLVPDTTQKTFGFDRLNKDMSMPVQKGWNIIDFSNEYVRFTENGLIIVLQVTGLEEDNFIDLSGSVSKDYSWMSSLDYKKDFSLKMGKRMHKPAIRIVILE